MYKTVLNSEYDAIESILFLSNSYLTYYENYPAITSVLQVYECLSTNPDFKQKVEEIYWFRHRSMEKLFNKAQESGLIHQNLGSDILADMLLSTGRGFCLQWRMSNYEFTLRERAMKAIQLIIDSVRI